MKLRSLGIAALLAGALLAAHEAAPAAADEYSLELYNGLMSPYCPGRTLMDCPSGQAGELRDWIAAQEQAGRSRQEVEDELYEKYGDVILQAPRAEGFGMAAYVLPVVAFVVGGGIVWAFLRGSGGGRGGGGGAGGGGSAAGPRAAPDPEIERRIDEELRE